MNAGENEGFGAMIGSISNILLVGDLNLTASSHIWGSGTWIFSSDVPESYT